MARPRDHDAGDELVRVRGSAVGGSVLIHSSISRAVGCRQSVARAPSCRRFPAPCQEFSLAKPKAVFALSRRLMAEFIVMIPYTVPEHRLTGGSLNLHARLELPRTRARRCAVCHGAAHVRRLPGGHRRGADHRGALLPVAPHYRRHGGKPDAYRRGAGSDRRLCSPP